LRVGERQVARVVDAGRHRPQMLTQGNGIGRVHAAVGHDHGEACGATLQAGRRVPFQGVLHVGARLLGPAVSLRQPPERRHVGVRTHPGAFVVVLGGQAAAGHHVRQLPSVPVRQVEPPAPGQDHVDHRHY
ncbi:hypothetical protein PBRA_000092, partial [Plasmodiophora brassicae]